MTDSQTACAHSRVVLKHTDHPNGTRSDYWECADGCGQTFKPNRPPTPYPTDEENELANKLAEEQANVGCGTRIDILAKSLATFGRLHGKTIHQWYKECVSVSAKLMIAATEAEAKSLSAADRVFLNEIRRINEVQLSLPEWGRNSQITHVQFLLRLLDANFQKHTEGCASSDCGVCDCKTIPGLDDIDALEKLYKDGPGAIKRLRGYCDGTFHYIELNEDLQHDILTVCKYAEEWMRRYKACDEERVEFLNHTNKAKERFIKAEETLAKTEAALAQAFADIKGTAEIFYALADGADSPNRENLIQAAKSCEKQADRARASTPLVDEYEKSRTELAKLHKDYEDACKKLRVAQSRNVRLREDLEAINKIGDTFWAALKPLNLAQIYAENPGKHVADLIDELSQCYAAANGVGEWQTGQVAAKVKREMNRLKELKTGQFDAQP